MTWCVLQTKKSPAVFQALPSYVTAALGVRRLSPLATMVIDVESVDLEASNTDVVVAEALSYPVFLCTWLLMSQCTWADIQARLQGWARKRRLNTATVAATAVVEDKDMMGVMDAMGSSHLSSEAVASQKTFLKAMQTVCCVCIETFWNQHKKHELQSVKDLGKSIDLLRWYSRYNV